MNEEKLNTPEKVKEWLDLMGITNYTINPKNLFINVKGDVDLSGKDLDNIPVQFIKVSGDFNCSTLNNLTSLKGVPIRVGRDFNCSYNNITSLKYCPKKVGRHFDCSFNKLTSLQGSPVLVNGNFICAFNKITHLYGCPVKINKNFHIEFNKLVNLKDAPREIGGKLNCKGNSLVNYSIDSKINGLSA